MANKFEVGQKVRVILSGSSEFGRIGTITKKNEGGYFLDHETAPFSRDTSLELISEPHYTKINPKVGEKYRVVKEIPAVGFNPGDKIEYKSITSFVRMADGLSQWVDEKHFTTEFLELITEPEKKYIKVPNGYYGYLADWPIYATDNLTGLGSVMTGTIEPINKSIIQKTMSFIKRLTQSADDKTLEKANFINSCSDLTSTGENALMSLVFAEKKSDLVKLAEEVIAEEKE